MTGWASATVAGLMAFAPPALFEFQDDRITESSALVVVGDTYFTINDSGDSARVFAVGGDGETTGVTTFDADVEDVEALARGPENTLLVGDIGDNDGERDHLTIYQVPLHASGYHEVDATAYELVYQDGARDAEALLVHPRTGRVFVVSKGLLGGTVYQAPRRLRADRTNVLVPVGRAPGLVTDGTFFPDGRHILLRDYGDAMVLDAETYDPVGSFTLPVQEQGEGIDAVGDRVVISSEGENAPVQAKQIPQRVLRDMAAPSTTPTASPTPAATPEVPGKQNDPWGGKVLPVALGAAWVLVMVGAIRAFRRRSRYKQ